MMESQDDDWDDEPEVPISAIEHYSYCPRQCALIHVEGTYEENVYTMRGQLAHERVHAGDESVGRGVRTLRAIPLWSERLGIRGKADAVELHAEGPCPVEYKVGKPHGEHAALQLCAQALCLEEMLSVSVPRGAIFYQALQQRVTVEFDAPLRARTEQVITAIRRMLRLQQLPSAVNDARCPNCSLLNACLPSVVAENSRLGGHQAALFKVWDREESDV